MSIKDRVERATGVIWGRYGLGETFGATDVPQPAKRRIVAIATDQIRLGREARGWDNWEDMANQTLRALALPYADHPDYRDEWRP